MIMMTVVLLLTGISGFGLLTFFLLTRSYVGDEWVVPIIFIIFFLLALLCSFFMYEKDKKYFKYEPVNIVAIVNEHVIFTTGDGEISNKVSQKDILVIKNSKRYKAWYNSKNYWGTPNYAQFNYIYVINDETNQGLY